MRPRPTRPGPTRLVSLVATLALTAGTAAATAGQATAAMPSMANLVVPEPASVQPASAGYWLTDTTAIHVPAGSAQARGIAAQLAAVLRRSTGYPLPVIGGPARPHGDRGVDLRLDQGAGLGAEGYRLDSTPAGVVVTASAAEGLFDGVQTLRQLLPAAADAATRQPGPWPVAGGHVADHPRFTYRGAMLDVSRHFFPVSTVERYIDEISLYKVNYLHLHLSDDQGWRIAIASWPDLAKIGGATEAGGGPGGYYTDAQYRQLVAYAAAHYVTIVPEIDGPGHTNAALTSYARLNCDGVAPPPYTGTDGGFSSLCVHKDVTYRFEQDVLAEVAALTPGPYLHVGGDEARSTSAADYATFGHRVLPIVSGVGKVAIGWHDIAKVDPPTSVVPEFWGTTGTDAPTAAAAARGNKIIMAPATKAYLDMKYTAATTLGQDWAALVEVQDAYGWDPATFLQGVGESSVLGVEAPLWSETLVTMANIEYMAFPRLPAIAELGWSPESTHDWSSFAVRLGAQGPRWTREKVNFYASPQVPWAAGTVGGTD